MYGCIQSKRDVDWCDPQSGRYDFKFYISDEETKIVTATDTTITVKVPGNLSSGTAYIVLKEQVFYGPRLTVLGNIKIDQSYGFKGTSGTYLRLCGTLFKSTGILSSWRLYAGLLQ